MQVHKAVVFFCLFLNNELFKKPFLLSGFVPAELFTDANKDKLDKTCLFGPGDVCLRCFTLEWKMENI